MKVCLGCRSASASFVGPVLNPPSSATSRTLIPSRSSSATVPGSNVSSAGLPCSVEAGRISPRARGLVFSVTSAKLRDESELVGLAQLALADRPGVGVEQRHDPVPDRLARHTLADLPGD